MAIGAHSFLPDRYNLGAAHPIQSAKISGIKTAVTEVYVMTNCHILFVFLSKFLENRHIPVVS